MKRGEIWTVAGGKDYAGKPRPCVIIQDDRFDGTNSVTVCGFSTDEQVAPFFRLVVEPDARNGLRAPCSLMVDKINTVPRSKLGQYVGLLASNDLARLNRAIFIFLGLSSGPHAAHD